MSTNSSHQTEIELDDLIGAFILTFWPVSLLVAMLEYFFYDGYGTVPINLAVASLAGMIGVKKHQADLRRRDQAT